MRFVLRAAAVLAGFGVLLLAAAVTWFYSAFYPATRANGAIISSGRPREYLLHVPPGYDPRTPTPLVISLHGAMLWPGTQMRISQWNRVADRHGFIVVYPSGTALTGSGTGVLPKVWLMAPQAWLTANVQFISALIDTLEVRYNVDRARIYASGFSNGGGMVFALSCTLGGRIAAVGTAGAAEAVPWSSCRDTRPVPMIAFHGTADPLVPYGGAPASWLNPAPFPPVLTWTANWARRNQCAPAPADSTVAPDVSRREYRHCANDAAVVLYTVRGGGHAWPGGTPMPAWVVGRTTSSVDASSLMWDFFQRHPRAMRWRVDSGVQSAGLLR